MGISTGKSVPTHHSLSRQHSDYEKSTVVEPRLNRLQTTTTSSNTLWGVSVHVRSVHATTQDTDAIDEVMKLLDSMEVNFDEARPHERVDDAIQQDWDESDDPVTPLEATDMSTLIGATLINGLA